MKALAFLLVLLAISLGGFAEYRHLEKTTFLPLWLALYQAHFPVEQDKISGNFGEGFRIESLREESDDLEVNLQGIDLRFSSKEFADIESLVIQKISVRFKENSKFSLHSILSAKSSDIVDFFPKLNASAKIANLEIAKIDIADSSGTAKVVDRVSIQNLHLDQGSKSLSAGRAWFTSSLASADFHDVEMTDHQLSFNSESFLQISPEADPELLKSAVDLRFLGVMDDGSPSKMTVTAFGTRLTINFRGDSWRVTLSDFSPNQFLKFDKWFPMANINLTAAGPVDLGVSALALDGQRGSLIIGKAPFNLLALPTGPVFSRIQGRKKYSLQVRPPNNLRSALKGLEPLAVLGSSEPGLVRDILASVYYDRTVSQLSMEQKQYVDSIVKYFVDAPGAHAVVPHLASLAKRRQLRQPTSQSIRSRSGTSEESGALPPRELPPYRGPQRH